MNQVPSTTKHKTSAGVERQWDDSGYIVATVSGAGIQKRRHCAVRGEPVFARRAGERFDGVAELRSRSTSRLTVLGSKLEALGELVSGPVATALEERQQFQQSPFGQFRQIFMFPKLRTELVLNHP